MKKLLAVLFTVIFVFTLIAPAFAADMPVDKDQAAPAKKQVAPVKVQAPPVKTHTTAVRPGQKKVATYPAGPIQKLERGFGNLVFGWTEIPKRVVDKTKESNPIKGAFLGVWQGSCKAFARTVSGASEVLTFPIGRYNKPRVLPDMPAAK